MRVAAMCTSAEAVATDQQPGSREARPLCQLVKIAYCSPPRHLLHMNENRLSTVNPETGLKRDSVSILPRKQQWQT